MSAYQDMNNSVKQNASLKPSQRAKFKQSTKRKVIRYPRSKTMLKFKTVTDFELKNIKATINQVAQRKIQNDMFFLVYLLLVTLILLVGTLIWVFSI
ncbi:hypothetical protein GCM10011414_06850 [Croceivirga lutea]|nr:hypothetical protein GCM10011414_06850 [Croceivirga lutea]